MVERIGHVAFYVTDIEASVEFYARVFGFREAFRMMRDDGSLGGVYINVSEYQFLELFQATSPAVGNAAGTIGAAGGIPGYGHFCVQVSDLDAAYEKISAAGAPIDSGVRTGVSKCRMLWTHDPDGNKIEVMELPPESMQAQATERLR
jgi:lactoylglutathione lyase